MKLDIDDLAQQVRASGFAIVPDFLPPDDLGEVGSLAAALASSEHAHAYPKSTRVWDLYRHGQPFLDILGDPRLDELASSLLGPHYLLSDYSLNVVLPGQPVDGWHIDYPYNEMSTRVAGSILGLQCILALNDFDLNGATQLIPGSHTVSTQPEPDPAATTFAAEAGTLLVLAASTWHRSGFNASTRPRTAALVSLVERWVRPMTDPPEPGPWSQTEEMAIMLGVRRPPETINGVPI